MQKSWITTPPDQNKHKSQIFSRSGCTKVAVCLVSEQHFTMGFLFYQRAQNPKLSTRYEQTFSRYVTRFCADKGINCEGKESHTKTLATETSS